MNIIMRFIYYFNIFCMGYTLVLSLLYIAQLIMSYLKLKQDKKRMPASDYGEYADSENLLPISLVVPAHNEQENIIKNIEELLKLNYPQFELIVVNDGSTDHTHQSIIDHFNLKKIQYSIKVSIPTKDIRAVYYNFEYPNLIYVDKERGGKSDALNAGINVSSYPLFACLDADSRLEKDSLLKLSTEFLKDTSTVVAGGFVRIANGSVIENGEWKRFKIPEKIVEKFQIVEYFRAFLAGRISWGITGSMLIVSGAFGVFSKQAVIDCGGYKNNTIGEDMEIIVRLHRYLRKHKRKYRMKFYEDAICWTQGPMSLHDLRNQRRRWQVGLMDSLLSHKAMMLNPRYGFVGLFSMPYNLLFELLGALIEVLGYFIIPLSLILGILSPYYFILYLMLAVCLGIIYSFGGLILEQIEDKGYMSAEQCFHLTRYAVLENFGYRQYVTLCRVEGMLRYHWIKNDWGKIRRKTFNK
ncbi:MAG: glycosyltransferase family 2 protein [Clostridiales bacterium]|nr:glycosyltransferase family 2 protein [Clostridiales bacterium]